jgi:RNA exonuclease 1
VTAGETVDRQSGYVQTKPVEDEDSALAKQVVYALDCEMCYTTAGLELTRVTVVNMHLEPVYETLVQPSHTIVDYNTR